FIFYMSGTPGTESHQESSKVVSIISENKNPRISLNNKKIYLDTIVRKNAHAFEYTVLAFLVSANFFSFDKRGRGVIVYILFICLFYAVTDEFHQSFVPDRTSRASDILIDFGGSLIGMLLFYLTYYKLLVKKKAFQLRPKKNI
ncbi:MAG: VanZ family protein, partial [Clostridiaceae bacterium]